MVERQEHYLKPDYQGGSIVNLMTSIVDALGGRPVPYPPLAQLAQHELAGAKRIVLLIIDGLGYHYLRASDRAPNLQRHLVGPMTSVFPSTTASAITTFLTGTAPLQHGLTGWFMYFRELGTVAAVLPQTHRHYGTPLALSAEALDQLLGYRPLTERLPVPSVMISPQRIADSPFNRAHAGPARILPYRTQTGFFDGIVEAVRAAGPRRYIYAYWPDLDSLAHRHGIAADAVAAHLGELDAGFGNLLERIAGSDTALLVTADHGFVDTTAERTLQITDAPDLAGSLLLPLCGERRAAFCYVRSGTEHRFEAAARSLLGDRGELCHGEELIEAGYFGLGEMHPRFRERIGDYVLLMRDGYTVVDRLLGESPVDMIGVHGSLTRAEMEVPLVYAGV